MTVICKGTTKSGNQCRNRIRCGQYCGYHCDQKPIEFYPSLENWPNNVLINRYKGHCVGFIPLVLLEIQNYQNDMLVQPSPMFYPDCEIKFSHRLFLIKTVELIKRNACICYGDEKIDRFIFACVKKLEPFPELKDYIEDFKRRCLKSYSDQARKNVYRFYLNGCCNLCPDVIEKIVDLV